MAAIIVGTTPTIKYTFTNIDTTDLTEIFMTIAKTPCGTPVLEKDLSDAEVGDGEVMFQLTQEETLSLPGGCYIQLNYKLTDGTRGATDPEYVGVGCNQKAVVI